MITPRPYFASGPSRAGFPVGDPGCQSQRGAVRKSESRGGSGIIYWLPKDIIDNTIAAFHTDVLNQPSGYSAAYGIPSGRYIAPANSAGCQEIYAGQCSHGGFVINGIPFMRFDLSLVKKARISEHSNFELRAEFLNALNNINFRTDGSYSGSLTMGRVATAYRDTSTTNDPGGRLVQFVLRLNF